MIDLMLELDTFPFLVSMNPFHRFSLIISQLVFAFLPRRVLSLFLIKRKFHFSLGDLALLFDFKLSAHFKFSILLLYLLSVAVFLLLSLHSLDSFLLFGFFELVEPFVGIILLLEKLFFDFLLLIFVLFPDILNLFGLLLGHGRLCIPLRLSSKLKFFQLLLSHSFF